MVKRTEKKPAGEDNAAAMSKRRERRMSKSAGSKRKQRQAKRKSLGDEGGKQQRGSSHLSSRAARQAALVAQTEHQQKKQQFTAAANEVLRTHTASQKRAQTRKGPAGSTSSNSPSDSLVAASLATGLLNLPAASSPASYILAALQHVSPIGFFSEQPQLPSHQFISVPQALEILDKVEKKEKKAAASSKKDIKFAIESIAKARDGDAEAAKKGNPGSDAKGVQRAKKLVEERASVQPFLEKLRANTAAERSSGLVQLVAFAKKQFFKEDGSNAFTFAESDSTPAKIEAIIGNLPSYVFGRLIKGVASGIGGARVGFSQGLAELLKDISYFPVDYVLDSADVHLPLPSKNDLNTEQKQIAWGALFVCLAVIASGRDLQRVHLMVLLERLTAIRELIPSAKELIAVVTGQLFERSLNTKTHRTTAHKVILPKIVDTYFTPLPATSQGHDKKEKKQKKDPDAPSPFAAVKKWSPEAMYLYIKICNMGHTSLATGGAASAGSATAIMCEFIEKNTPSHNEPAQALAEGLLSGKAPKAFAFFPRTHAVWHEWLAYIACGSDLDVKKTVGNSTPMDRLRVFWDSVVVGHMRSAVTPAASAAASDATDRGDDRRDRQLLQTMLPHIVSTIASCPPADYVKRTQLIAHLCSAYPSITSELLKSCTTPRVTSSSDAASDPKHEAAALVQEMFNLGSDDLKRQLHIEDDDANDDDSKQSEDDKQDSDEEKDEADESADGDAAELANSSEVQERDGYNRFSFNMRKVLLADMKRLALRDGLLQDPSTAVAFQTICQFLVTHAFFSVPDGAVDADGLMSHQTFSPVLRKEAADHLFTLFKHLDSQAAGTRPEAVSTRRTASNIVPGLIKLFQRLASDPSTQAVYETPDELKPLMKKVAKYLTTGTGKVAKPTKEGAVVIEDHHRTHLEYLLTLLFFDFVMEGDVFANSPEMTAGMAEAVDEIGRCLTSGQCVPRDLLDALLTINLRGQEDHVLHLGAVINKISLTAVEFMLADHLRAEDDISILLAPLSEEQFAIAEDGVDLTYSGLEGKDGDEEEAEEDEEDEEEEQSPAGDKKVKGKSAEQKDGERAEEEARDVLEKQLSHARMRCLQYLQVYLTKVKGQSQFLGLIAVPVMRLAELSMPKVRASQREKNKRKGTAAWGERDVSALQNTAPVLSGCCAVLSLLAKCPLTASTVQSWPSAYPDVTASLISALQMLCSTYCKDKEKMQMREGKHLKAVTLRVITTIVALLYNLASVKGSSDDSQAQVVKEIRHLVSSRSLNAALNEAVVNLLERCPAAVGWAILPAVAEELNAKTGRPYHRKVVYELALSVASKWTLLHKLQSENAEVHSSLLEQLFNCCCTFDGTDVSWLGKDAQEQEAATDSPAWRNRKLTPAAISLHVALLRYLEKIGDKKMLQLQRELSTQTVSNIVKGAKLLDLETKAALRKAWPHVQTELNYKDDVQPISTKPLKDEINEDDAPQGKSKKRKRDADEKARTAAEAAARERKLAVKKAAKQSAKELATGGSREKKDDVQHERKEKKQKKSDANTSDVSEKPTKKRQREDPAPEAQSKKRKSCVTVETDVTNGKKKKKHKDTEPTEATEKPSKPANKDKKGAKVKPSA